MNIKNSDLKTIWELILSEIKPNASQGNFGTLLKPTELLSIENGIATISATSPIIIHMLRDRFGKEIKALLERHTKEKDLSVVFIPQALKKGTKKIEDNEPPLLEIDQEIQRSSLPVVGHLPRVRADYTFENFAVSGSNQLAFVSSTTVAKNPGKSYNPLFIYGPVGVGKTHLMHAIANEVYFKNPTRKIIYITSEEQPDICYEEEVS
jgi:chromosomal replication initiator protein